MAYNYWVIYMYVPKSVDSESFSSDVSNSDAVQRPNLGPIVQATIANVARYKEGMMSPELKRHYDEDKMRNNTVDQSVKPTVSTTDQRSDQRTDQIPEPPKATTEPAKKSVRRSVDKEHGITKLIIFHMKGCGHCTDIMERKQQNNKTKFEHLVDIFAQDPSVHIIDFQYGRDREAEKYNGFPVLLIVTGDGEEEYTGPREVPHIAKALINKKQ
jgi:hypothetical protein